MEFFCKTFCDLYRITNVAGKFGCAIVLLADVTPIITWTLYELHDAELFLVN
jgi:hypothetical protein